MVALTEVITFLRASPAFHVATVDADGRHLNRLNSLVFLGIPRPKLQPAERAILSSMRGPLPLTEPPGRPVQRVST
jgi:hypothetical protein